jgi:hypothetical protein
VDKSRSGGSPSGSLENRLSHYPVRHAYARHPQLSSIAACLTALAVDAWRRHVSPDDGIGFHIIYI